MAKAASVGLLGASLFLGGLSARAEIDYDGIKYLGGQEKVDLNNANVRVYAKIPGMYPTIAGKIASTKAPFKTVADVYNIPGLTASEKDTIKKVSMAPLRVLLGSVVVLPTLVIATLYPLLLRPSTSLRNRTKPALWF